MEEKSSTDKDIAQDSHTKDIEKMDCDEALSASESAEVTENTDSSDKAAGTDEKLGLSSIQSEPTSGIEMTSVSTTSASEVPCEGIPASATEDKPSQMPCGPTSDIETASKSTTAASEMQGEGALVASTKETQEPSTLAESAVTESKPIETPCAQETTNAPKEKQTAPNETSTPPKKSFFSKIGGLLSPPKSGKSKASRSKSMSPSEKKLSSTSEVSNTTSEETRVASEAEEHVKKASDKPGMLKTIKRGFSKIGIRIKSSTSDSKNLVSDEEVDKVEDSDTQKPTKDEAAADTDKCTCNKPKWIDNSVRSSLSEKPSWDGTGMTDIPSSWSGADVFPSDTSRKPSETGENTSEEAVAGSLSSPDEHIPDIQEDKDSESEGIKKDDPSTEESQNVATAEHCPEDPTSSEENSESQSKDEVKPETVDKS